MLCLCPCSMEGKLSKLRTSSTRAPLPFPRCSMSVLVIVEMFNALNALSGGRPAVLFRCSAAGHARSSPSTRVALGWLPGRRTCAPTSCGWLGSDAAGWSAWLLPSLVRSPLEPHSNCTRTLIEADSNCTRTEVEPQSNCTRTALELHSRSIRSPFEAQSNPTRIALEPPHPARPWPAENCSLLALPPWSNPWLLAAIAVSGEEGQGGTIAWIGPAGRRWVQSAACCAGRLAASYRGRLSTRQLPVLFNTLTVHGCTCVLARRNLHRITFPALRAALLHWLILHDLCPAFDCS